MESLELRNRAERYRRLAAECRSAELAKLLRVYAEAYDDEAAFLETGPAPEPRPQLCG
jgi:hypothetical protein